ncbi:preprotein translocase subunit SecE [Streptococcus sp. DD13]|uniref:preprotein translocase subunit SecE n=1 Tax=Streptococcus sp. DD13 TaxID=1777881 RepID=UPI000795EB78|nr:preprotein translocase subunit SecE [Streptococcus sp. DD13]KXT77708.1 Preprotein translocase subunit SecE [Streptococcus sp. DD13]
MKFIGDVFRLLRKTTWPSRKQGWTDFVSVIEYTAFFVVLIYLFDLVVSQGIYQLIQFLR